EEVVPEGIEEAVEGVVEAEEGTFTKKGGKWFDEKNVEVPDAEYVKYLEEEFTADVDAPSVEATKPKVEPKAEEPVVAPTPDTNVFKGKTDKQIKRINKVVDLTMEDPTSRDLQGAGTKAFIKKHKEAIDSEVARITKEAKEAEQAISEARKKKGTGAEQEVTTADVKSESEFLDEAGKPITPSVAEIKREERIMKSKDRAIQETSLQKLVDTNKMTPEQMELAMAKYDAAAKLAGTKSEGQGAKQGGTSKAKGVAKEKASPAVPES
ncbi:unnamed protein product, partial [marine sediment metagenome]